MANVKKNIRPNIVYSKIAISWTGQGCMRKKVMSSLDGIEVKLFLRTRRIYKAQARA